jgi:general secretion pathway protein K
MTGAAERRGERGLALVSVLWGVAILSLIAAAMLTTSVSTAYIDRNAWNATRGGAADDAVVNLAVLQLMDDRSDRQPRTDGTPRALVFDGVPVQLWIQDESGKININFTDRDLLLNLFVSQGASHDTAGDLADRILDRRKAIAGRSGSSNLAFRNSDELLTIPGISRELFVRIRPAITVYGRSGTLNQEVAPLEALLALPNMDRQSAADLIKHRQEAWATARQTPANKSPNSAFTVTVEARVSGARVIREAVVQFTGDEQRPYLFLSWK